MRSMRTQRALAPALFIALQNEALPFFHRLSVERSIPAAWPANVNGMPLLIASQMACASSSEYLLGLAMMLFYGGSILFEGGERPQHCVRNNRSPLAERLGPMDAAKSVAMSNEANPTNNADKPVLPAKLYVEESWQNKAVAFLRSMTKKDFWSRRNTAIALVIAIVLLLLIFKTGNSAKDYDVYEVFVFDMAHGRSYSISEYSSSVQQAALNPVERYYSIGEPASLGHDSYVFRRHPDGVTIRTSRKPSKEFKKRGPRSLSSRKATSFAARGNRCVPMNKYNSLSWI